MKLAVRVLGVLLLSLVSVSVIAQEASPESRQKSTRKSQAGAMFDEQGGGSQAAAASSEKKSTASAETAEGGIDAPMVKRMARLPRYFSSLVSTQQREEIYRIQLDYLARIEQLQQQLDALKAEELAACEQVWDDGQRTRLLDMRTAAMERAKARSSAMGREKPMNEWQDDASTGNSTSTATEESDTQ